ncbi:hypothetical protein HK098_003423 [Nowakowskiella sp. JEL0407]|nr:hypothetical protein HK098_003423 [Nowakowskiella sp. JEL0407]
MDKPCECCCECHLTVQESKKQHQEEIIQRRNAQKQSLENQKQGLMWGLPRTRAPSAVKPSKTLKGTTVLIQDGKLDIVNSENERKGCDISGNDVAIEKESNSGRGDSRPTIKNGKRFDHKPEIALQQWEKMNAVTYGITVSNGNIVRGRSNSAGVKRPEFINNSSVTRPTISSQRRSVSSSGKQNTATVDVTTKNTKIKSVLESPSIVNKQLLSEYKTRCEIAETEVTWLLEIIKEFDPDGTILAEKYLDEKDKSTKLILSCRDCQSSNIVVKSVSLPKSTTKSPFLANKTMESFPDIIFNQQNQDEKIENEQKVTFIETANFKKDSNVNQIPANIFALHNDNDTQYFTSHNQNAYNQQFTSTQPATVSHNITFNGQELQQNYDVPLNTASSQIPLPRSTITQPTFSTTQQSTLTGPTATIQTQSDPIAEILQTTDQLLKSSLRLNETNSTPSQLNPQQERQPLPHSTSIPNRHHQQSYSFSNSNQLGGHTNIAAVQHRFSSTTALPTTIRTTANDTFKCRPKVVPTTVDSCTSTTNLIHCNDRVTSTQSLLQDQEQTQKHFEVSKQLPQTAAAISGSINRLNFATQYLTPIPSQLASSKMKKTVVSTATASEDILKSNGNMYRVANISNDNIIDEEDLKLQQQKKQREEEEMLRLQKQQIEIQKQEFQQQKILEEKQLLLKQQQIQQQMQLQREQQMLQERLQLIQLQQEQSGLENIRPPQIIVDHHKTPTGSNTNLTHKSMQNINNTSTNYHSSSVSKSTANINQGHGQQHYIQKKKPVNSASNRDQLLAMFQNFLAHSEELENDIRSRQPSRTPSEILLI